MVSVLFFEEYEVKFGRLLMRYRGTIFLQMHSGLNTTENRGPLQMVRDKGHPPCPIFQQNEPVNEQKSAPYLLIENNTNKNNIKWSLTAKF